MIIALSFFAIFGFNFALGCGGLKLEFSHAKNCGGSNPVITMLDKSIKAGLNEKCEVSFLTCSRINPYESAKLNFSVFSGKMRVLQMTADLCEKTPQPDFIRSNMVGWSVPNYCPINETFTFCNDGKKRFTLSKTSQRMLSLFSTFAAAKVIFNITHNTGISCFEAFTKVVKI